MSAHVLPTGPDLILYNAKIYTVDQSLPWAQAVAIQNGTITAVGDTPSIRTLAADHTRALDMGEKVVLPGLCDAHIHFYDWSIGRYAVQLAGTRSKNEMLQRIAEKAQTADQYEWITGRGWNESHWGTTAFPTASDIDSVTGDDQPAIFWRSDMHCVVANHAALRLANITASTPDPAGGVIARDAHGQPNGILKELAIDLVARLTPGPDRALLANRLEEGMGELHRLGITAIHDQRMNDQDDGPRTLAALGQLRRNRKLHLRVNCNIAAQQLPALTSLGLYAGFGDDCLRLGHVKLFADGSLGSRTAWMLEPFRKLAPDEDDNYGVSLVEPRAIAEHVRQATQLGFPISIHAIGDRANRVCLDVFEELADLGKTLPFPHRIEHVQTLQPTDLPRLAQLNITASVQPVHAIDDMDNADQLLGQRGRHMYNFRSLMDSGALIAFGSDAPVADNNPFLGFHAAICRQRLNRMDLPAWYADERIDLLRTIYAYTMGPALAAGWQETIGSITPGKRADLIVLDRDIFRLVDEGIKGDELAQTQVVMTLFDGEIVYQRAI